MTMGEAQAMDRSREQDDPRPPRDLRHLLQNPGYLDLVALLALPFIVMLVNDSWTFLQPIGTLDPWIYTGYFFNLEQHLNVFRDVYYGSRFPWILLGNSVHSVFSPATG